MTDTYPSKKAKRKAEYLKRKEKRDKWRNRIENLRDANDLESMAKILGVRLQ